MFSDPEQVGITRVSLGPFLDRHIMAIQTTRTVQNKPLAMIFGDWAGGTRTQDLAFFRKLKGRKIRALQKTHWLAILGDFNARRAEWGDTNNRRGAMLKRLAGSLGLTRITPLGRPMDLQRD